MAKSKKMSPIILAAGAGVVLLLLYERSKMGDTRKVDFTGLTASEMSQRVRDLQNVLSPPAVVPTLPTGWPFTARLNPNPVPTTPPGTGEPPPPSDNPLGGLVSEKLNIGGLVYDKWALGANTTQRRFYRYG